MNQLSLKKENEMMCALGNIKTLAEFNAFIDKSKVEDWAIVNIKDNDIKEMPFMRQLTHPHWDEAMKCFKHAQIMYGKFICCLVEGINCSVLTSINISRSS